MLFYLVILSPMASLGTCFWAEVCGQRALETKRGRVKFPLTERYLPFPIIIIIGSRILTKSPLRTDPFSEWPTILSERWSADASAFLVVARSVGDPLIAAPWKKSRTMVQSHDHHHHAAQQVHRLNPLGRSRAAVHVRMPIARRTG